MGYNGESHNIFSSGFTKLCGHQTLVADSINSSTLVWDAIVTTDVFYNC